MPHVLQQCLPRTPSSTLSRGVLQSLGSSAATQPSTSSETALRGPLCDTASMFIPVAPTPCAMVPCIADELEQELAAEAPGDSGIISAVRSAQAPTASVLTSPPGAGQLRQAQCLARALARSGCRGLARSWAAFDAPVVGCRLPAGAVPEPVQSLLWC